MPKVKHPTVRGVEREVPKGDLDAWLAQGWVEKGERPTPKVKSPSGAARDLGEHAPDAAASGITPKAPRSATTRQQ